MRFGQFLLQILLVYLLRIAVLVHVQIEGLSKGEILLIGYVRLREIVFINWFSDS